MNTVFQPRPGQGQYVRPAYLNPQPPPRIPIADPCRSRLYSTLVGTHEGSIYMPGFPGRIRIIRPAIFEGPDNDFLNGEMMSDTYVEVEAYQSGQQLFAPAIGQVRDRTSIRPEDETRLTLTLDREGNVEAIECG